MAFGHSFVKTTLAGLLLDNRICVSLTQKRNWNAAEVQALARQIAYQDVKTWPKSISGQNGADMISIIQHTHTDSIKRSCYLKFSYIESIHNLFSPVTESLNRQS